METGSKNKLSGKFIVLDGPDGCGKSTQTRLLAQWIEKQGFSTETFRDPGTTAIGEQIRKILLDPENTEMSTRTEILLYMAARAQLWKEMIAPALQANKCVILDRWLSSTCAYQGHAGGFGIDKICKLAADSLQQPWPDLTIILDIDLETAKNRLNSELDRMEQKDDSYHKKVRDGFLKLADHKKNFAVVDAAQDIAAVHEMVLEVIKRMDF